MSYAELKIRHILKSNDPGAAEIPPEREQNLFAKILIGISQTSMELPAKPRAPRPPVGSPPKSARAMF